MHEPPKLSPEQEEALRNLKRLFPDGFAFFDFEGRGVFQGATQMHKERLLCCCAQFVAEALLEMHFTKAQKMKQAQAEEILKDIDLSQIRNPKA